MEDVTAFGVLATVASPLFLAILQAVKKVEAVKKLQDYMPLISIALGVVVFVAAKYLLDLDGTIRFFVLVGLVEGLSASGLWSGTKSIIKKKFPSLYVNLYNK